MKDSKNVEEEIREIGLKPVDGQNFLNSEVIIKALVEAGEVEGEKVLEIGAGTGAITEELVDMADKVYAVERDRKLADFLREKFAEEDSLEVLENDILKMDLPEAERCVANLPFQISSEVLELLGKEQLHSSLILQEELVNRAIAEPGDSDYGRFSVMVNYYFIPVKLREVSSRYYYPAPEVDTAILKLYPNKERHNIEDEETFFQVVKALFTHKRKKLRNAFVDSRNILGIEKDEAKQVRDEIPYSEERVVNLDIKKLSEVQGFLAENEIV